MQNAGGVWGQSTFYIDGVGNRTHDSNVVGGVTSTGIQGYALNSNRILGKTVNGATTRTFTYDGAGNILTDTRPGEVFAFVYNKRNRPASVTRNSVAYATYGYNALEQLTTRITSAPGGPVGTIRYIYDLDGHLISETDGTTTRDYIWAAANDNTPVDLPLAIAEAAVITHVHTDHLGRPTRMTDAAKATVWQATFKPWGEVQSLPGTKALNLRFPGQYFQIETNLAYNHHRQYDPTTGRYTQPDPLGFVDGPSVYAYAGNCPWVYTDRDGCFSGPIPYLPHLMARPLPPLILPLLLPPTNPKIYEPPPREQRYPSNPREDRRDYKRVCDQPPPSGLNKCELAQWIYGRAKECLRLRKTWKDEYGSRRHDQQIPERETALQNAWLAMIEECGNLFACSPSGLNYSPAPLTSSWP